MEFIKYEKCIDMINMVLEGIGILETVKKDSSIYVGGSLPAFIISQQIKGKNDKLICNDIDLYTDNYAKTLYNFTRVLGKKIHSVSKNGVNISFLVSNKPKDKETPIQIITSEFISFYDDIIGSYDSTLVAVGYYPYENKFIIHDNFIKGLNNKNFECYYERSNPTRIQKLTIRAKDWFNSELNIIKKIENFDFSSYSNNPIEIDTLQDIVTPPNYTQLYHNKFNCIKCGIKQSHLLCSFCNKFIENSLLENNKTINKKVTILGGVNGLGKIIKNVLESFDNKVYSTSRYPPIYDLKCLEFSLGKDISDELLDCLIESDIIILNAYSTLENNENIWKTTIDTFDEDLALDKFMTNSIGYVKFLQEFIKRRKRQTKEGNFKNILMVFMDANESKFAGKLMDGKHLELNMAKTATKQIFYTNANLLASLGIITMCYDPGWLSYHGISVDKIESKSKYLISPYTSALCLTTILGNINFEECMEKKKFIFDTSIYDFI